MQDVAGFSNKSEFSSNLQTDDDNALSLTSGLAVTALKSHSKVFSTEVPKSVQNLAGADNWRPERWSTDTPSSSSLSSSDSSPYLERIKKRQLAEIPLLPAFQLLH